MSSYIIAGSADSIDTAYCQQIARRISSKYKNIDFRIVIKHPTEWEDYLQEICRIYGFHKKSNPIIYTFDGKNIGGRENFVQTATTYFGLDEQALIAENISSKINMKLADELLKQKKIVKNGTKTFLEKITFKHKQLLSKNILKNNLKQKQTYLINGIEYIHRQINAVSIMKFIKNAQIPLVKEQIVPEQINLMALSLNDQIKPEEPLGKQAFVTANQKQKHPPSEQDKMSEASKTNKMHQSIISYDKDSKGVKQSNQTKLRIDEQNDDVPDFIDYPYGDYLICELPDHFCIAFDPKSLVGEEMIFYHNEDPAGNILRMHNDGRPIKGHRVLIKEIHYENQNLLQEGGTKNQIFENENIDENQAEEQSIRKTQKMQKPKTEPNIPAIQSQKHLAVNFQKNAQQDAISEPHSDLNLISHLNFHTLFIHKPLSVLQLRNLIYFINQTNTIGCLQFLPQNPNPRVKLYLRKHLLPDESYDLLPAQRFIEKQVEQGQFIQFTVPSQKGVLITQQIDNFKIRVYNQLGFTHYAIELSQNEKDYEKVNKIIKYTIDHMLSLEQQVRHDIGYNLVFTKKRIMISPLVEPYASYNGQKLYYDGLALLGYVHTAKLERPYEINEPKVGNQDKGREISMSLAKTTGYTNYDE